MSELFYPLQSLREGRWFKLICGASYQHLPAVRSLALAFTLAGADCIDVAADPAVIGEARAAIDLAAELGQAAQARGFAYKGAPWLMVSFNDGEDPHFRKATFDVRQCPPDCPRPCEAICPAQAIVFETAGKKFWNSHVQEQSGVVSDRCYGCGRCLPVCPLQHITTRAYVSTPAEVATLVLQAGIDAVEIHTQVGRLADFQRLWTAIAPWVHHLQAVAISCPDGEGLIDYLWALHDTVAPLPCALIWQMDGRPMSGDIGAGTTHATIKLAQKVLDANLPGYLQLAGGTNHYTVPKLRQLNLLQTPLLPEAQSRLQQQLGCEQTSLTHAPATVAGVAYGSYARALLLPILNQLETTAMTYSFLSSEVNSGASLTCESAQASPPPPLEAVSSLLWQAVDLANSLVAQLKSPQQPPAWSAPLA